MSKDQKLATVVSGDEPGNFQIGSLTAIGLSESTVKRNLGALEIIALGFNIANSWVAVATSLAIAIAAGGTVTLIYGVILASIAYMAVACTLGELASVYPTAGGQYHFTSVLSPQRWSKGLSYACGIIAAISWVAINASVNILSAQILLAVCIFFHADYLPQDWHYFMVYQVINLLFLVYNLFVMRRTPWIHDVAFALTLVTFFVVTITCLARSDKRASEWVWTSFENNTGWNDGVTFLTGLITPAFMFCGLDATLHLAEEVAEPQKTVPRALMSTMGIGFITGLVFSVAMCYSISDLDSLLAEPMPIFALWRTATGSVAAGTVFMIALFIIAILVSNAIQQTASHLIWSLARDNALAFSAQLAKVHSDVPAAALILNAGLVFIAGCLFMASTTAFSSFVNTAIILQMVSFAFPASLLLVQKRSQSLLPASRSFRLPEWLGWCCNVATVAWAIIQVIFFTFPTSLPVSASSTNYAAAVLAFVALAAAANWVLYARKHYAGPRVLSAFTPASQ